MLRFGSYSVAEVFDAMNSVSVRGRVSLSDGLTFRCASHRLVMFRDQGTACVSCDVVGTVFIAESHSEGDVPHLNLYAVLPGGNFVLMTKDHVHPKSKGGRNVQENYQVMCGPCNWKKSDTLI